MKNITIDPKHGFPSTTVWINDKKYVLPTGVETSVDDSVAALFEAIENTKPYMEPSGGGGSAKMVKVKLYAQYNDMFYFDESMKLVRVFSDDPDNYIEVSALGGVVMSKEGGMTTRGKCAKGWFEPRSMADGLMLSSHSISVPMTSEAGRSTEAMTLVMPSHLAVHGGLWTMTVPCIALWSCTAAHPHRMRV